MPELSSPESDLSLDEIEIREDNLEAPPSSEDPANGVFWRRDDSIYLHWAGVGTYAIRNGNEILFDAAADSEERRVRLFLLGAAMGALLHQRGIPVFHAAAVEIDGNAVAFLGDKGRGKSTLAAVLVERGHRLLTDDVLAIDTTAPDAPAVFPAFPQLKLWPDALEYLGETAEDLPRISSRIDKRDRTVEGDFGGRPVPFRRVYVLGKGDALESRPVAAGQAVLGLVKNAYPWRFGNDVMAPDHAETFRRCSSVAAAVTMRNLVRPSDLQLLPATADLIEREVAGR